MIISMKYKILFTFCLCVSSQLKSMNNSPAAQQNVILRNPVQQYLILNNMVVLAQVVAPQVPVCASLSSRDGKRQMNEKKKTEDRRIKNSSKLKRHSQHNKRIQQGKKRGTNH